MIKKLEGLFPLLALHKGSGVYCHGTGYEDAAMTRKKKIRLIVIMPAMAVTVVIGGLLSFVLIAAGTVRAQEASSSGAPSAVAGAAPEAESITGDEGDGVSPSMAVSAEPPQAQPCDFPEWIGKPVDEAAVKATGRPYRILGLQDAMTFDYSPDRINVRVDDKHVVMGISCG